MSNFITRSTRRGFHDYEAFLKKFEAKKTTDDCYTPTEVYDAVVDYVFDKAQLPEDTEIVRPFYPNGDYTAEEYPEGCVVIDNPPFSILSQIVRFYIANGVRFFLFAPQLTLFNAAAAATKIIAGANITYANGALVRTAFLTNLWGDSAIIVDGELNGILKRVEAERKKKAAKTVRKLIYPDCVVSAALLGKIAARGITLTIPASEMRPIKSAGGVAIFGGGYLLSRRAAAERAAAERAAAECIQLTAAEQRMQDELDGVVLPYYEQTLF